jgi:lysyl-tRNA synthetase class 2
MMVDWRPSALPASLVIRARLLQRIRAFFQAREVLEVETPLLSRAAVTDPHIESFVVQGPRGDRSRYLHTSPEFAMKRLLAAGSGSIYQVCKVFREGEAGRQHNPEFSMLEWYRLGFNHLQLMTEVDDLLRVLLDGYLPLTDTLRLTYREAFQRNAGIDPLMASIPELQATVRQRGIDVTGLDQHDKDPWLDLLMTHVVEPALPRGGPVFIYDYPASQAALARIRQESPPVAERFELYLAGMELANGFHELTDAVEQRQRFTVELASREASRLACVPVDERFLAALESGLPACAGVALGIDRLVMLAAGVKSISEVIAFDDEHA